MPGQTKGIFVDNDPDFRLDVATQCEGFTILEIDETPRRYSFGFMIDSDEYTAFVKRLSSKGKAAASTLKTLMERDGVYHESYDPRSGIQESHVKMLKDWVLKNKHYKLIAAFDFDRTLTMMEGGHFVGTSIDDWKELSTEKQEKGLVEKFTAEGFAEYLAGGSERVKLLQDMFDFLYEHSVECFVLTNNGACMDSRGLLKELAEIYTNGNPIKVVCGLEYGGRKSLAIKSNTKAHKFLCSSRKARKRARKTRKSK
jgi:hypothetical protein